MMKQNYKIIVSYDGTRYRGWQKQTNTGDTIQGKLEALLSRMAGEEVAVQGAGRTDAGVHALGQTANFRMDTELSDRELMDAINGFLPDDIAVLSLKRASERFHSRLSAVGKAYCYRIYTGNARPVLSRRYVWNLGRELSVERMEQAAAYLTGLHDFKSFCGNPRMKKSTVRRIDSVKVWREPGEDEVRIRFEGNGFLQNMVRIMTGTLAQCGLFERDPEEIPRILEARDRSAAGPMAPASGLTLVEVKY